MIGARLDESLKSIASARRSEELIGLAKSLRDAYQLAHLVYLGMHIPGLSDECSYLVATYSDEWTKQYVRGKFFWNDPVLAASRDAFLPIDWATLNQQSLETCSVISEAGRYGINRQGVSLPMRGPYGDAAIFTFMINMPADEWSLFRNKYTGEIAIIGQYFHERVIRILADENDAGKRSPLSPRERECLQFLVDGQAPKQIAATLNLSEAAVRLYLRRARTRLGAPSLLQAVIIALRTNLIHAD
jgi:DNA-binding CsgD family transcriptional regulator